MTRSNGLQTHLDLKFPGSGEILPAMLQIGIHILSDILARVFRASLAMGYIPTRWRHVKVVGLMHWRSP